MTDHLEAIASEMTCSLAALSVVVGECRQSGALRGLIRAEEAQAILNQWQRVERALLTEYQRLLSELQGSAGGARGEAMPVERNAGSPQSTGTFTRSLGDWLRESARSGLLFGRFDEPLDDYGKRIVRAILAEIDHAEMCEAAQPQESSEAEVVRLREERDGLKALLEKAGQEIVDHENNRDALTRESQQMRTALEGLTPYLSQVADRIIETDGCAAHDWLVGVAKYIKASLPSGEPQTTKEA